MKIHDIINEVADQPYKPIIQSNRAEKFVAIIPQTDSGSRIQIRITQETADPGTVEVGFFDETDQAKPTIAVTGKGDAFRIFATVGAVVNMYVKKFAPDSIEFGGKSSEGGRIKLYDMIARNIGRYLPGYKLDQDHEDFQAGEKRYKFSRANESIEENFADGKGPGKPGDSQRHGIPKHATMSELDESLNERKMADLYHSTDIDNLAAILKSGQLTPGRNVYVSLTRDKNYLFAKDSSVEYAVFVIDQAKLAYNKKIEPYDFHMSDEEDPEDFSRDIEARRSESEERVKGPISLRYVKAIMMPVSWSPENMKKEIEAAKQQDGDDYRSDLSMTSLVKQRCGKKLRIIKTFQKLGINVNFSIEENLEETLKKVKGEWALVSRKNPKKVLQYYHGSGHPSKDWVSKVERRVHSFESIADLKKEIDGKFYDLTETREGALNWLKSYLPNWPEYVLRDWLYRGLTKHDPGENPKEVVDRSLAGEGMSAQTQWKLIPNFEFKIEKLHPDTQRRINIRAGGSANPMKVPKDAERHATQAALAQQQGGVRKEPVIGKMTPQGFELIEGWHRTIQHFKQFPDGYRGPAWVAMNAVSESLSETNNYSRGEKLEGIDIMGAPVFISHHAIERLDRKGERSVDVEEIYEIIEKAVKQHGKDIAKLHNIDFMLKGENGPPREPKNGFGIALAKNEDSAGNPIYMIKTVHPRLLAGRLPGFKVQGLKRRYSMYEDATTLESTLIGSLPSKKERWAPQVRGEKSAGDVAKKSQKPGVLNQKHAFNGRLVGGS